MARPLVLSMLASLLPLVACEGSQGAPPNEPTPLEARVLLGTVDGTDIVLGALLDGDALAVYQCGGAQTFATETRWYQGEIGDQADDPDAFALASEGTSLVGTRDLGGLHGDVELADGSMHAFELVPVADDAEAGVYLAEHDGLSSGVIVRGEAGSFSAQGASCDGALKCFQVIILAPIAIEGDTLAVQVDQEGTLLDAEVTRTLTAPSG